jgi:hypothetical protein
MENQEEICKEIKERWAKLGLTDNIKNDIENNVSNLTNEEALPLVTQIVKKTIGFDLESIKYEDIGNEIQKLVEKFTKDKFTTNDANGITEQLVGYPTGKGEDND